MFAFEAFLRFSLLKASCFLGFFAPEKVARFITAYRGFASSIAAFLALLRRSLSAFFDMNCVGHQSINPLQAIPGFPYKWFQLLLAAMSHSLKPNHGSH
ncbi:MAG: hypothetical protein IPH54_13180 [Rhodoferax sp.]|nr:hypothetical protein [Rhodoferax sp.]